MCGTRETYGACAVGASDQHTPCLLSVISIPLATHDKISDLECVFFSVSILYFGLRFYISTLGLSSETVSALSHLTRYVLYALIHTPPLTTQRILGSYLLQTAVKEIL